MSCRPLAALAAFLLLAGPASGAEPAVIRSLTAAGAEVRVLGERGGLAGWWIAPQGGEGYALWTTPDGHAVMGVLYDAGGNLVPADALRDNAPVQVAQAGGGRDERPIHARALEPAIEAAAFHLGASGPRTVVFADPACSFSRSTVAVLAEAALAGELRLSVVPVALLGAASARMALAVVAAPDGMAAAQAWFGRAEAEGGLEAAFRIEDNNALFAAGGGTAVPLTFMALPDGVRRHTGEVLDPDAWLRPPRSTER